ncbi:MAG: alpha/beta fold hydrolase [Dehalococcoidia bacterium]
MRVVKGSVGKEHPCLGHKSLPAVVGAVIAIAALVCGLWDGATARIAAEPAQPEESGPEGIHRRLLERISFGDVDGAMAMFADDANVWDALGCVPNCLGKERIRAAIETAVHKNWQFSAVEVESHRTSFTAWTVSRTELRGDDLNAKGIERILAGYALALRGGRIASLRGGYDITDEQTRLFRSQPAAPGSRLTGTEIPPPAPSADGVLIDVGGRRIYMECMGVGSPTVIFEGGSSATRGAASGGVWTGLRAAAPHVTIQQDVARFTRACAYDPAGVGLSDPRPRPSTGRQDAADMHLLLQSAGFAPPYVVVGISYGGQVAQLFASMYPAETAGVALLDSSPGWDFYERFSAILPPELNERYWTGLRQGWQQAQTPQGLATGTDLEATLTELREMGPLPNVPLAVLTAGVPFHPWNVAAGVDVEQREQIRYETQAALAQLAPGGSHRIFESSEHAMNVFVPAQIVDAIRYLVEASRSPAGAPAADPGIGAAASAPEPAIVTSSQDGASGPAQIGIVVVLAVLAVAGCSFVVRRSRGRMNAGRDQSEEPNS